MANNPNPKSCHSDH